MSYLVNVLRKVNRTDIGMNKWAYYSEKLSLMALGPPDLAHRRKVEKLEFPFRRLNKAQ